MPEDERPEFPCHSQCRNFRLRNIPMNDRAVAWQCAVTGNAYPVKLDTPELKTMLMNAYMERRRMVMSFPCLVAFPYVDFSQDDVGLYLDGYEG